eukprot:scaffold1856_cov34-Prasinocladus_malaysianus.AAC.1
MGSGETDLSCGASVCFKITPNYDRQKTKYSSEPGVYILAVSSISGLKLNLLLAVAYRRARDAE